MIWSRYTLSGFILTQAVRKSVAARIWHPFIQVHWLEVRVLAGKGGGCRSLLSCLMSRGVCYHKLWGVCVCVCVWIESLWLHTRFSAAGDRRESSPLIVSLRVCCMQVAMIHEAEDSSRAWNGGSTTAEQWTYTISQDKDLTRGGAGGGSQQLWGKINKELLILEGHVCHSQ